jgi:sortase A
MRLQNKRILISEILFSFAFVAILYAGYQTVWTSQVAESSIEVVRSEIDANFVANRTQIKPKAGQGFAYLHIPKLGAKASKQPIISGVRPKMLKSGVGHYPRSAKPGDEGNFAIAGHRASYGQPFARVDKLKRGDRVIVETPEAWYVYRLHSKKIVKPNALWVLDDNPNGLVERTGSKNLITITTCHPRWGSKERWIWWGTLEKVLPPNKPPKLI